MLIGAVPLYNNNKIMPANIISVPKAEKNRDDARRQSNSPGKIKIIADTAIIAQLYKGICRQAYFILLIKLTAYAFTTRRLS